MEQKEEKIGGGLLGGNLNFCDGKGVARDVDVLVIF